MAIAFVILALLVLFVILLSNSQKPKKIIKSDVDYYTLAQHHFNHEVIPKNEKTLHSHDISFTSADDMTGEYLVVDCETTGLPKNRNASVSNLDNWPRMVQLAWMVFNKAGQYIKKENFYIDPGIPIPYEATKVNGITNQFIRENGVHPVKALRLLREHLKLVKIVVCHNVEFDVNIIESEFIRYGFDRQIIHMDTICTMISSVNFLKLPGYGHKYKYPKLSELYGFLFFNNYDISIEGMHNSEIDVEITSKCFFDLKKLKKTKLNYGDKNFKPSDVNVLTPDEIIIPERIVFPRVTAKLKENVQLYTNYTAIRDQYNKLFKALYSEQGINTIFGLRRIKLEEMFSVCVKEANDILSTLQ